MILGDRLHSTAGYWKFFFLFIKIIQHETGSPIDDSETK